MTTKQLRILGLFIVACYATKATSAPQDQSNDTAPAQQQPAPQQQQTEQQPTVAALNSRGMAKFQSGDIKGSIADFDAAIQRQPILERSHWQRGISYYYAESFDLGAKQFELYQTYDAADVENVVWRFLCQAAAGGRTDKAIAAAREDMLPLGARDRRIPMMEIDAMFRGSGSPEKVLAAAKAGQPDSRTLHHRMFYANLYIGLFYEATNAPTKAGEYIRAADKLKVNHYMWDVAHVHAERLRKTKSETETKTPNRAARQTKSQP